MTIEDTSISDDDDLTSIIEDLIGSLEDLKDSIGNWQQALAEISDIQSTVNVAHSYIAEKASE